ncbi:hypothetical protein, partial [Desulfosporosinus fructosivorans]
PAGNILVSRPALGKRIKAEFGYDSRKGVGACDRGSSWLGDDGDNGAGGPQGPRVWSVFRAAEKAYASLGAWHGDMD